MAEAFLINGVKMILDAVVAHVESEIALAWAAEGELKKLKDKLGNLQLVLHDAEKRQVKEPSVRYWLEKLKKVAYDAQDVMDDFSYEAIRQEKEIPAVASQLMKQLIDMVLNFRLSSNPFLFQLKMAHMIQDINGDFDKIKEDMEEHRFIEENLPLGPYNPGDDDFDDTNWETHSSSSESMIVGRESQKSRLVALLANPVSEEQEGLSVLPIVGMGGLGKTTLTQLIYNDEHIKNYFKDLQMWVYVSQDFDVKKVLADIITKSNDGSSSSGSTDDSNIQMLTEKLKRNLGGKRFLLVLDDVWNQDVRKWEVLRDALDCGAKGSKVIVTTRQYEVALLVGTIETCELKPLTCEDAWSLFRQTAFRSSATSKERQDLVEVGKRIVKKCGGVPLALKIIGSQLKSKGEDLSAWQFIEKVEIWDLPEIKEVFKVLKVSYLALPSHLKQCFSYCSVFRKGESIQVDTLVQLWMAEGFIHVPTSSGNKNEKKILEEDVGRQYVKSLLNCCFFEAEERDKWEDQVISFKMHDLVHDLAKSVVSPIDRTTVLVDSIEKGSPKRLQVAFTAEGASSAMQVLGDLTSMINIDSLRVLILSKCFYGRLEIANVSSITNLKRLRVLILKNLFIMELPDTIANLKHLRYLDISDTMIRVLPKSFTALYNLQTFKLAYCQVTELPSDITRKLNNLRHLEIGLYSALEKMPKELGQLKFLQTLPRFKVNSVSKESGHHISELGHLKHLRDKLLIDHLENVEDKEAAKSADLEHKPNIRVLGFTWSPRFLNAGMRCNDDDVLEGLQPNSNLRALKIKYFKGSKFPSWLNNNMKMLPNLVEVELHRLSRCECLPAFGSLPLLRSLFMNGMDSVKHIGSEFYGDARPSFPSLKKLYISSFENLEEWVEAPTSTSSSSFPVLEELELRGSVQLKSMPNLFPMLKKLVVGAIRGSIVTLLGASSNLTQLTSLSISSTWDLVELPPKLLSNNKSLQHLQIVGCSALQTIATGELHCLTSLEELKIGGFSRPFDPVKPLDSFSFLSVPDEENKDQFLPGLKTLELCDSRIASLPKHLEHFTTIEILKISKFPNIVDLPDWLGNFSSLRELDLSSCHKLEQLPSAEAMRRLTSLKYLSMFGCDQLARRCRADDGEEWHKISHIPRVFRP